MPFYNIEAKNLFLQFYEKYGSQHINSDSLIIIEQLLEMEPILIKILE